MNDTNPEAIAEAKREAYRRFYEAMEKVKEEHDCEGYSFSTARCYHFDFIPYEKVEQIYASLTEETK
jgi:hypothetical protein